MVSVEIAHLYRRTLRAASTYNHANFRDYFTRHAKETFRQHVATVRKGQLDAAGQKKFLDEGKLHLGVLKRQAAMSRMYDTEFPSTLR